MLAMLWGIGWQELAIVFGLALLLFGGKRLPEAGRGIGRSILEFRRALAEDKNPPTLPAPGGEPDRV